MIKIKRNCKEIEGSLSERNRSENRAKTGQKQGSARFRNLCEISTLLQNQFAASSPSLRKFSQLRSRFWHTSAISQHSDSHLAAAKRLRSPKIEKSQFHSRTLISAIVGHISITFRSSNYACNISFESLGSHESTASNGARFGFETEKLWLFEDDCANHERKCRTSISLLLNTFLKHFLELKLCI